MNALKTLFKDFNSKVFIKTCAFNESKIEILNFFNDQFYFVGVCWDKFDATSFTFARACCDA